MVRSVDTVRAGGQFRASDIHRELVIESLKDAFARGRLTMDEFETRIAQALGARASAELVELTADIPGAPGGPVGLVGPRLPVLPVPGHPLLKAAAGSGACLVGAFALVLFAADVLDPAGLGNPYHPWSTLCLLLACALVLVALAISVIGVAIAVDQKLPCEQLPLPPKHGATE
jgi:hypothetical protein